MTTEDEPDQDDENLFTHEMDGKRALEELDDHTHEESGVDIQAYVYGDTRQNFRRWLDQSKWQYDILDGDNVSKTTVYDALFTFPQYFPEEFLFVFALVSEEDATDYDYGPLENFDSEEELLEALENDELVEADD